MKYLDFGQKEVNANLLMHEFCNLSGMTVERVEDRGEAEACNRSDKEGSEYKFFLQLNLWPRQELNR